MTVTFSKGLLEMQLISIHVELLSSSLGGHLILSDFGIQAVLGHFIGRSPAIYRQRQRRFLHETLLSCSQSLFRVLSWLDQWSRTAAEILFMELCLRRLVTSSIIVINTKFLTLPRSWSCHGITFIVGKLLGMWDNKGKSLISENPPRFLCRFVVVFKKVLVLFWLNKEDRIIGSVWQALEVLLLSLVTAEGSAFQLTSSTSSC